MEKDILSKWDKIQTLSATVSTEAEHCSDMLDYHMKGRGTYECKKKDGELLIRLELTNTIHREPDGAPPGNEHRLLTVVDGESVYVFTEMDGRERAERHGPRTDDIIQLGGRDLFDKLHRLYELKLLADEEIDGRPAYVIEGDPRNVGGSVTHYFDRQTGVLIKMYLEDEPRTASRSVKISDLKVNRKVSNDRFVFTPPLGVELLDMTGSK